ncbi:hypothetical protein SAMN05421785_103274 [Chryseobacterium gambrini]|uniref:Uncharacterized protein n=1 Tax=Chryseobacterium gambrini TaxID=373672 RepID=A0A1N7MJA4_9FLAO|nr:hypothetical protein SAMN05421785_103274 [Chryseobacterium gambrini]
MGLYYYLTTNPKIKLFKLNIASLENNLSMSFFYEFYLTDLNMDAFICGK